MIQTMAAQTTIVQSYPHFLFLFLGENKDYIFELARYRNNQKEAPKGAYKPTCNYIFNIISRHCGGKFPKENSSQNRETWKDKTNFAIKSAKALQSCPSQIREHSCVINLPWMANKACFVS